ncbi:hypothetical protein ILUMI_24682 [Ignelater luminosus]|uniref:Fibrinogen C-terminal domain-containing protein n=1 Tax=Ignelater luminosus TaxID=2038154 RepID=A0A8K0C6P6_IGNLU|nr:hypothetical protein ILUMI_24682 [Ignelater luminosus]
MLLSLTLYQIIFFSIFITAEYVPSETRHRQRSSAVTSTTGLPFFNQSPPQLPHRSNGDIEYRLTRLEVLLVEKLENLRSEVRESTRRLQALEWQSNEAHSTLEGLRVDLNRFAQQIPSGVQTPSSQHANTLLEQRVDNLAKGIQILVAATRGLTSDINGLKRNITSIANDTRYLLRSTSHLVTKQFFNHGILELKHQQLYQSSPLSTYCPSSSSGSSELPKSCQEIQDSGNSKSGIYRIQPEHAAKPFMVVCDLETLNGGWTVIQNRFDGSQDFYQNWHEYKYGFGNLGGEFWIGLENIHHLTGYEVNELFIELQDLELQNRTAHYAAFSVGPEVESFTLKVLGGYSGNAGDSLLYHAGSRFSTKDMDQDGWPEGSCAQAHGGAWWYRSCDMSNLNGRYLSGELPEQYIYQGMYWGEFRGAQYSLLRSRMLVRPRLQINPSIINDIFTARPANGNELN